MDNLCANILIGNDIIGPEGITIDVANQKAYVPGCKATVQITARQRGQFIRRALHAASHVVIPPQHQIFIPVRGIASLPQDRDFYFEPTTQPSLALFAHLVDHKTKGIVARNESFSPIQITRKTKLGVVTEVLFDNCFAAEIEADLAMTPPRTPPELQKIAISTTSESMPTCLEAKETCLPNGIMVYGTPGEVQRLADLVNDYPTLWKDEGFVNVPMDEWMRLPLQSGWESKITGKAKVYPAGLADRECMDKVFDRLH